MSEKTVRKHETLEDAARKALAVLQAVEWNALSGWSLTRSACPKCDNEDGEGHTDGCALAEAITDLGKVLP